MIPVVVAVSLAYGVGARADDQVVLRDGSFYRGEIIEKIVGDHITMKLVTGDVRQIPWESLAPAPLPTPPAPPVQPPPQAPMVARSAPLTLPTQPGPSYVRVQVTADDHRAMLEASTGGLDGAFARICVAPCSAVVDQNRIFRVGGDGVSATDSFSLSVPMNTVDAQMKSTQRRPIGRFLALDVGTPIVVVGGIILGIGALGFSIGEEHNNTESGIRTLVVGGVIAGAGLATLTTGIVLWATSNSTVSINGKELGLVLPGRAVLKMDGLHF